MSELKVGEWALVIDSENKENQRFINMKGRITNLYTMLNEGGRKTDYARVSIEHNNSSISVGIPTTCLSRTSSPIPKLPWMTFFELQHRDQLQEERDWLVAFPTINGPAFGPGKIVGYTFGFRRRTKEGWTDLDYEYEDKDGELENANWLFLPIDYLTQTTPSRV